MTPSQQALHEEHMARQRRINARAYKEPVAVLAPEPEPTAIAVDIGEPNIGISEGKPWFRMSCTKITIREIQEVTIARFGISRVDLLSRRRDMAVVLPRQIAMYLSKKMTIRTLPEIGFYFGGKDHTTVLHAVDKIEILIGVDPVITKHVETIQRAVEGLDDDKHESRNGNPTEENGAGKSKASLGTTG